MSNMDMPRTMSDLAYFLTLYPHMRRKAIDVWESGGSVWSLAEEAMSGEEA